MNLAEANLAGISLSNANLSHTDLSHANLSNSFLPWCNFSHAILLNTNLSHSNLMGANLTGTNLRDATLVNANLARANLTETDLSHANVSSVNLAGVTLSHVQLVDTNLHRCKIWNTLFAQVDLTTVKGLETIEYRGPSYVDLKSVQLPDGNARVDFLRGVGCSEDTIHNYNTLFAKSHTSCFISHSDRDSLFAQRLFKDLQNAGIRCWFALHDLQPDPSILRGIDGVVRSHERLVIILSDNALRTSWIEPEIEAALHLESQHQQNFFFPIRLDDALLQSQLSWAMQLHQHDIGDFTHWQDDRAYTKALAVLLDRLNSEERTIL